MPSPMTGQRLERTGNFLEAMRIAMDGRQAEIWTALPGVLTSFNPAKRTCSVRPTIQGYFEEPDGTTHWEVMPQLEEVPVQFPGGGGFVLTFPLAAGDEGIIVLSARCIDTWWELGPGPRSEGQVQAELRMHDLSDGFFIPTLRSLPNVEPAISTSNVQLRSVDGETSVTITPSGAVDVVAPGDASVTAPSIVLNGNVTINGNVQVSGDTAMAGTLAAGMTTVPGINVGGIPFGTHTHGNVQSGPNTTGGPL